MEGASPEYARQRSCEVADGERAREARDGVGLALRHHLAAGIRERLLADGIPERIRLGIVAALAANDTLSFADLKDILRTTDGNLSVHARKLEEAGYVRVTKGFEDRKPKTEYRLTAKGRRALESYLAQMEQILSAAREALERS